MSSTWSHYSTRNLVQEWRNATHFHPQLDESLYKTWEMILLGILAGCISLITICGNLTVLMSFFLERSIRQPSNYFIASLAVSDLLIGTISMPLYTTYILTRKNWPLGEILCDLWLSIDYTACMCSIYTIFCITIDRFCSIRLPTKYRVWRTERKVLFVVFLTWAIPITVFFTSIFGWQYFVGLRTVSEGKCYVQYMDDAFFNCFLQVGYFWTTLVAMIVLYTCIYRVALDLHRRSEQKRGRHLNSLATMAGCTIGQLSTVIGMSRGPKHNIPSVPPKKVLQSASPSRHPDNGYHSREVRTTSDTVVVTSVSPKKLLQASPVRLGDNRYYSREVSMLTTPLNVESMTRKKLLQASLTRHPDNEYQSREEEESTMALDATRISSKKLPKASPSRHSDNGYLAREMRESTTPFSTASISPKKLPQVSPTICPDNGYRPRQTRAVTESTVPLSELPTWKRQLAKNHTDSELSLTATAFYQAIEHGQECRKSSVEQSNARRSLDFQRNTEYGETSEEHSEVSVEHPDAILPGGTCRKLSKGVENLNELSNLNAQVTGRRGSACSTKDEFNVKGTNSRYRASLGPENERKRVATTWLFKNRTCSLCSESPERRCVMKRQNRKTRAIRKGIRRTNLIPLELEENIELVSDHSDPGSVLCPNLARNDAELGELLDSDCLLQGTDGNTETDLDNEYNYVSCVASNAKFDPHIRNRKSPTLHKYRTETHLECISLSWVVDSYSRRFLYPEDQKKHLDYVGFDGDVTYNDTPRTDNRRLYNSETDFPTGQASCPSLATFNTSLLKRFNQLDPVIHRNSPAPSAGREFRVHDDPEPAYDIFWTQTSAQHSATNVQMDWPTRILDNPVTETSKNPSHHASHAGKLPEHATSDPKTFQSREPDDKVDDDVINPKLSQHYRTCNRNAVNYLKVPDFEQQPIPDRTRDELGNGPEYGIGFETRLPVGFKRLLQRSRRGRDGYDERRRNTSEKQIKNENRARKALRTITIILGAFVLCWTPWHVLSLIIGFCSSSVVCVSPVLYDISYWLCYLNSPINPFCYAFVNQQFKKTFLRVLRLRWHRT